MEKASAFFYAANPAPAGTAEEGCQMATYTANYQLHQWVPEDNFLRTDFNQDFQKIDAALASLKTLADGKAGKAALEAVRALAEGRTRAILGGYVGNEKSPREINVDAVPEGVFLITPTTGYFSLFTGGTVNQLTVTSTGFRVEPGDLLLNGGGLYYTYLILI